MGVRVAVVEGLDNPFGRASGTDFEYFMYLPLSGVAAFILDSDSPFFCASALCRLRRIIASSSGDISIVLIYYNMFITQNGHFF